MCITVFTKIVIYFFALSCIVHLSSSSQFNSTIDWEEFHRFVQKELSKNSKFKYLNCRNDQNYNATSCMERKEEKSPSILETEKCEFLKQIMACYSNKEFKDCEFMPIFDKILETELNAVFMKKYNCSSIYSKDRSTSTSDDLHEMAGQLLLTVLQKDNFLKGLNCSADIDETLRNCSSDKESSNFTISDEVNCGFMKSTVQCFSSELKNCTKWADAESERTYENRVNEVMVFFNCPQSGTNETKEEVKSSLRNINGGGSGGGQNNIVPMYPIVYIFPIMAFLVVGNI